MPLHVIKQVNYLGKKEGMPLIRNKTLLFERHPGIPFDYDTVLEEAETMLAYGDDDDDDDFVPSLEPKDDTLRADDGVDVSGLRDILDDADDVFEADAADALALVPDVEEGNPSSLSSRFFRLHDLTNLNNLQDMATTSRTTPTIAASIDTPSLDASFNSFSSTEESLGDDVDNSNEGVENNLQLINEAIENAPTNLQDAINDIEGSFQDVPSDEDDGDDDESYRAATPAIEELEEGPEETRSTYSGGLRNRNNLRGPSFNEEFNNPVSSKRLSRL